MRELRGVVLLVLGLVLAANLVTGGPAAVVLTIVGLASHITLDLQTVMLAVAVPAFLVGGLLWLSPWQRELGSRIMAGAVVVAMVAVLGAAFLHWFAAELSVYRQRLFGVTP
jgi:hypothetical protein